eukprot:13874368-Alexandrium_andersonii.AAC.1
MHLRVLQTLADPREPASAWNSATKFGIKCPHLPEQFAGGNAVEFLSSAFSLLRACLRPRRRGGALA